MTSNGTTEGMLGLHRERFDRQLRIKQWDQDALEQASVGLVGDDDFLASLFVLSSVALGIKRVIVVAPHLDSRFVEIARAIDSEFELVFIKGYFTHSIMADLFAGCGLIVDLTHYGFANKLLVNTAFKRNLPLVKGFCFTEGVNAGFRVFTYRRGREWQVLNETISSNNLPGDHFDDPVLDIIVSGLVLEEVSRVLMGKEVSEELIEYERTVPLAVRNNTNICVVGAGALGTFVGLGLALLGLGRITFIDPDVVDETNLNRQVLFYGAIGEGKAVSLAEQLNSLFETEATGFEAYFTKDTDVSDYDVIFDCVDNFETRIILSEVCEEFGKLLISGGTSAEAGQVVVYNPENNGDTPANLLGLHRLVENREVGAYRRDKQSCVYQPEPSVIMTNQIIGGFMVDAFRMATGGGRIGNIFYDARAPKKYKT